MELNDALKDILDQIIGTTKETFEVLKEGGSDVISLYMFYYYTAKRQGTNQAHATNYYCQEGIGISLKRIQDARKYLKEKGLITDVQKVEKGVKGFGKRYTKLNYIFKGETLKTLGEKRELTAVGLTADAAVADTGAPTNALSINNKLLKENKKLKKKLDSIRIKKYTSDFESFWKTFVHVRGGNKRESFTFFEQLDCASKIKQAARLLKMEIISGLEEHKYLQACQNRLKNFVPKDQVLYDSQLYNIYKHIDENFEKDSEVYSLFKRGLSQKKLNELRMRSRKEVQTTFISSIK